MQFKNDKGYIEKKSVPWLWALLFGGLYFIVCGLWAPFIIWLALAVIFYSWIGPAGTVFMFIVGLVFAALAPRMVRNSYLRKGWVEITDSTPPPQAAAAPMDKTCPRCAETIKVEAKVCRFCQHDLTAAPDTTNQTTTAG